MIVDINNDIILKIKNLIKNTKFENNLLLVGGYVRDLFLFKDGILIENY